MSRHLIITLIIPPIIIGGMILLWRFNPSSFTFYPRCPFYVLTGYKCPGCGTLRAIHHILNGNIGEMIDALITADTAEKLKSAEE